MHARGLLSALVVVVAVGGVACGAPKPTRLVLDPAGPFTFDRKGKSETLKVQAWADKQPYVDAVPITYATSDATVATVDAKGVVVATGSGDAVITGAAYGLTTEAKVHVSIVGSVEIKDATAVHILKLSAKAVPLEVVVKDDKGQPIAKPKLMFRATDYCVEVDEDGTVHPLAIGECDVVVTSANATARVKFDVR